MSNKPKILIVADTFYPQVDGVIRFMEEFISRSKNDFELTLLVPGFDHKKEIKGIKTIFLEASRMFKLSTYPSIKLSFKNLRAIKRAVKQTDIVFAQDSALAGYLSIKYARRYHKKALFYTHQFTWKQFEKVVSPLAGKLFTNLVKNISVKALNRCDLVLLPYSEAKEEFRKAGVNADMKIARLGIDINKFLPSQDKQASKKMLQLPNKLIIGYVGRISKEKNTLVLLNAFNRLNHQKFFLLMVGDGQPEIVEKFQKNKNCKVTGFVDNVQGYLQAMDIFVMPSLVETTSLATLEAMSCGLPVIVTKVGFMKEYVIKDHNGLFFPRTSPALLAMKIEKLARNPALREKLSYNARKTIAYSFSWERSINKVKKILLKVYYQQ